MLSFPNSNSKVPSKAPRGFGPPGRRRFRGPVGLLLSLLLLCGTTRWGRSAPLPIGVLDPLWPDRFDYLVTAGAFSNIFRGSLPLSPSQLHQLAAQTSARSGSWEEKMLQRLMSAVPKPGHNLTGSLLVTVERHQELDQPLPSGRWSVQIALGSRWTLFQEVALTPGKGLYTPLRGASTADRRVRPWNPEGLLPDGGYVADFRRAGLRVETPRLAVQFGRFPLAWGYGRTGTLLLSDASPSWDGLLLEARWPRVQGQMVLVVLNRMWHDAPDRRYLARRYLAAHRVVWRPFRSLELGVMDSVVYGGEERLPELGYGNPLLPFYADQFNNSTPTYPGFRDDNVGIGFDVRWSPGPGWSLYGEWFIDDFRYSSRSNDPHALAWLTGIHRVGWRGRGEWRLEYARVGRYTYTHLVPENQYTHFGLPIGYPLGNDADQLLLALAWWPTLDLRVELSAHQVRKGESTLADRFWGESNTAFLRGNAEVVRGMALQAIGRQGRWVGRLLLRWERVRNSGFLPGITRSSERLEGAIGAIWP